jgi:hypothetical protein
MSGGRRPTVGTSAPSAAPNIDTALDQVSIVKTGGSPTSSVSLPSPSSKSSVFNPLEFDFSFDVAEFLPVDEKNSDDGLKNFLTAEGLMRAGSEDGDARKKMGKTKEKVCHVFYFKQISEKENFVKFRFFTFFFARC